MNQRTLFVVAVGERIATRCRVRGHAVCLVTESRDLVCRVGNRRNLSVCVVFYMGNLVVRRDDIDDLTGAITPVLSLVVEGVVLRRQSSRVVVLESLELLSR